MVGCRLCLARSQGRLHAIVDRCTHQDVPLSEGDVEDGAIECFMHGSGCVGVLSTRSAA